MDNQTEREWVGDESGHHFCEGCLSFTHQIGDEYEHLCTETGWLLMLELDVTCTMCGTKNMILIGFDEIEGYDE